MQDQLDPVESALESLRGRHWPGDHTNHQLKDKLMREFQTKRAASCLSRRGVLIATLAALVLGSAGFAAGGGIEMIKGWFLTVEVKVNGEVVDTIDIDEADIIVETDGDAVTLTIEDLEIDTDVEGPATAEITVIATPEMPADDE